MLFQPGYNLLKRHSVQWAIRLFFTHALNTPLFIEGVTDGIPTED